MKLAIKILSGSGTAMLIISLIAFASEGFNFAVIPFVFAVIGAIQLTLSYFLMKPSNNDPHFASKQ